MFAFDRQVLQDVREIPQRHGCGAAGESTAPHLPAAVLCRRRAVLLHGSAFYGTFFKSGPLPVG